MEEADRSPEYPCQHRVVYGHGGGGAQREEVDGPDHGESQQSQHQGGEHSEV